MKKSSFIIMMAVLLVATTWSISPVRANGNLDQILANMQAAGKKVSTIKAVLTQKKSFASIGGSEVYRGDLLFKHVGQNDKVRINYSNGSQISVDPKEVWLYQPGAGQAIVTSRTSLSSQSDEYAFFSTPYKLSTAEIKARYDISYAGEENGKAILALKPKVKSAVQSMKWWVDQTLWLPTRIEMVEGNGDRSMFTLTGVAVNERISDDAFKLNLPAGTKIVRK